MALLINNNSRQELQKCPLDNFTVFDFLKRLCYSIKQFITWA